MREIENLGCEYINLLKITLVFQSTFLQPVFLMSQYHGISQDFSIQNQTAWYRIWNHAVRFEHLCQILSFLLSICFTREKYRQLWKKYIQRFQILNGIEAKVFPYIENNIVIKILKQIGVWCCWYIWNRQLKKYSKSTNNAFFIDWFLEFCSKYLWMFCFNVYLKFFVGEFELLIFIDVYIGLL